MAQSSSETDVSSPKDAREVSLSNDGPSEEIAALFQGNRVSYSDFAAVISDLRQSGQKPTMEGIKKGLQEMDSPGGRAVILRRVAALRRNRPGLAGSIRTLNVSEVEARPTQGGEDLTEGVPVPELQRLRDEVDSFRREMSIAQKREEQLKVRLKEAEERSHGHSALREELHRNQITLRRMQQKEESFKVELKNAQARLDELTEAQTNSNNEAFIEESRQREATLRRERDEALVAVSRTQAEVREVTELRRALKVERSLREDRATGLPLDPKNLEQLVPSLQRELAEHRSIVDELLQREESLRAELEQVCEDAVVFEEIEREMAGLRSQVQQSRLREQSLKKEIENAHVEAVLADSIGDQLAEQKIALALAQEREAELFAQLEELSVRAGLVSELEDRVASLQAVLDEFPGRKAGGTGRPEQENQSELLEVLRLELRESASALAESRQREAAFAAQIVEVQERLTESEAGKTDESREIIFGGLREELALRTQELKEAHYELADRSRRYEEVGQKLTEAEFAGTQAREAEAQLNARLEEVIDRAAEAEEKLAAHASIMEEGRQRAERINLQLREVRQAMGLPAEETPAVMGSEIGEATFEESITSTELLLAQIHREVEQAQQYKGFLQGQLKEVQAQPEVATFLRADSIELKQCLAETLEIELARQNATLQQLTQRESILRTQLEKTKPQTIQAQSLELELSGQHIFREDLQRREAALTRLLHETLASLRASRAPAASS